MRVRLRAVMVLRARCIMRLSCIHMMLNLNLKFAIAAPSACCVHRGACTGMLQHAILIELYTQLQKDRSVLQWTDLSCAHW